MGAQEKECKEKTFNREKHQSGHKLRIEAYYPPLKKRVRRLETTRKRRRFKRGKRPRSFKK